MIGKFLLGAATAAALAIPAAAQDFAITNATVAIGDGSEPMENATVVVRDGRIVAAGTGASAPVGMQVIDGTGKWVTPGIFSAVTNLGLSDVAGVSDSNDESAGGSPFSAALDVAPAINPTSQPLIVARADGITRASIAPRPASGIFGGQGAVIDLGADPDAITRARAFQVVALGEYGARLAGGGRSGTYAWLDNALREALAYAAGRWQGEDAMLTRADAKALGPVVSGKQALYVEVERTSDIREVLRLTRDFPRLDLVLMGVSEGWLVAREIAAAGVPVIADPLDDLPSGFDQLASTQSNIGRLREAGEAAQSGAYEDEG